MTFELAKLIASKLDVDTAKVFVKAAKAVIDATLIVAQESKPERPNIGGYQMSDPLVTVTEPLHGWLSRADVHNYSKSMSEAIKVENWTDGFIAALMLLSSVGAL